MRTLFVLFFLICSYCNADSGVLYLGNTGSAVRESSIFTDLDYSKDFSVEFVCYIPPHAGIKSYSGLITKTTNYSTSGWGLWAYSYGLQDSKGYSVYSMAARISDGVNASYPVLGGVQGWCYFVLNFNVSTKVCNIYLNNNLFGTDSNNSIDLGLISNTTDFKIGAPVGIGGNSGGYFGQYVSTVRLWNRLLSTQEIGILYNSWKNSKNTVLSISNNLLKSEWLMREECGIDGGVGVGYIKDTVGNNHLHLLGGAVLQSSGDVLSLISPAESAINVGKSVILVSSGGESSLSNPVLPLSYQFQISESNDF